MVGALFPGQGSQRVGMGTELAGAFGEVRALFEEADAILGVALSELMADGPAESLVETRNTQPALYLHSVAVWKLLAARGVAPVVAAGHSLGEYSALHAAGALGFEAGLRTVRLRGELMFSAGLERPGAMAAILGMDAEAVDAVVAETATETGGVVQAANYNAPGQTVISGEIASVERAMELARERGARRAQRLPVSGAFHSALVEPAAAGLEAHLAGLDLRAASFPVVANVSARPLTAPAEIRAALAAQMTRPVRWVESIRHMVDLGIATFIEVGTGTVLKGLLRRIAPEAACHAVDGPASLEAACVALQGGAR